MSDLQLVGIDDNLPRRTLDLQLYFDQTIVAVIAAELKIIQ